MLSQSFLLESFFVCRLSVCQWYVYDFNLKLLIHTIQDSIKKKDKEKTIQAVPLEVEVKCTGTMGFI